ncbi:nucleotidyltransferase family protein [Salinibacter ruber]|uniref:nucleotidyltransferase family protein n=1 Tax=Salinibacter ruber TaxID=146919 RepID=UPI0021698B6C|nr:nucleotidyltransferase family protein [Salinibacter ruber]MCS3655567.1 dTDP-glucose pyrophosphorylase [Salinibacter ruber]MCS4152856.1 dTDP-glucose pyrophosphorylase [Salinibacter ruber]MCS4168669.1 dTDP-glucose pyrophosphorylase [Salinibacter ruber]MCS4185441.1 dTDP-glucose pyrophosphorylase [Salinibacter ruber]
MTDWRQISIRPDQTIREALEVIDEGAIQIAIIADEQDRLQGVVTDGDIRRGILEDFDLDTPVSSVMNEEPITVRPQEDRESLIDTMRARRIHQIPLVDREGRVVGVEVLDDLIEPEARQNPVVLMAGGLGTRLRPLTEDCPKPLLEVGDKPILETILEGFIAHGFHRFYVSVNYKAGMIEDYFGDGSDWGVDISYVHEEERLGTAGPLSLLPERPSESMIVMNGDLLTKLNYAHLLDFHREHGAAATMCVREHEIQVPYGVIETDDQYMEGIEEKPTERNFVNAGIYVLEPETLDYVPESEFFDMPDLFKRLIDRGKSATVFPVREYWQDVGRKEDFHRVNGEYEEVFDE